MVVRRFRKHVAKQDWFAVTIDLAIVVLGVFLGIQASNWNAARIETNLALSYRERLIDEVKFNIRQHRQQSAYYQQVLDHGHKALASLQSGRIENPAQFVIDSLQLTQVDTSPAKNFIYNEMMSAGLVNRLGDIPIQQAASDYYTMVSANNQSLQHLHPYRDKLRGIIPYAVQGEIQQKCGDQYVYHGKQIIGFRLAQPCRAQMDPSEARATVALIRQEPGVGRDMVRYLGSVQERLGSLDDRLILGMRLLRALEASKDR